MFATKSILFIVALFAVALTYAWDNNKHGYCDLYYQALEISTNDTYCDNIKSYCTCLHFNYIDHIDNCIKTCYAKGCHDCSTNPASIVSITAITSIVWLLLFV